MTLPIGYHELPETLAVWRETLTEDGLGGTTSAFSEVGKVRAKVSQPPAVEQIEAMQAGAALMMTVHLRPEADVRRGDELRRPGGERLRVKYAIRPSEPVYLRVDCEQIQSEGDPA